MVAILSCWASMATMLSLLMAAPQRLRVRR
jgi:hypothetical protein